MMQVASKNAGQEKKPATRTRTIGGVLVEDGE